MKKVRLYGEGRDLHVIVDGKDISKMIAKNGITIGEIETMADRNVARVQLTLVCELEFGEEEGANGESDN